VRCKCSRYYSRPILTPFGVEQVHPCSRSDNRYPGVAEVANARIRQCVGPLAQFECAAYYQGVKLKESNPYLKSATNLKAALLISVQTSSAIEGIHAPFAKGRAKSLTSKKPHKKRGPESTTR
jgi:hypothetical protein